MGQSSVWCVWCPMSISRVPCVSVCWQSVTDCRSRQVRQGVIAPPSSVYQRHQPAGPCHRTHNPSKKTNGHCPTPNGGKSKRVRTIFTPEQLERLEAEFERQQYMVGPERLYLAHTLQLTEAQVKVSPLLFLSVSSYHSGKIIYFIFYIFNTSLEVPARHWPSDYP